MKVATLCFPVKGDPARELLMGYKKTGFGRDKYNGFGGKVESGETIVEAAMRELHEETGLTASAADATKVGELTFHFPWHREFDMIVHVFLVRAWSGVPRESREMIPEWFPVEEIPWHRMWADDVHWLPKVLNDRRVRGTFFFEEDNETIAEAAVEECDAL